MLTFLPVRGTLQAVVATWYAQNFFSLWLAPIALAAVYYLLPKITGRVLHNYDFAIYGFWALLVFGPWMGGRQLIGGPVPAWIATVAIASSVLVLFHHFIVVVNVRDIFRLTGSTALFFVTVGIAAYLLVAAWLMPCLPRGRWPWSPSSPTSSRPSSSWPWGPSR
jgi:cytochrome c oxidase cbb3-type subunit 1